MMTTKVATATILGELSSRECSSQCTSTPPRHSPDLSLSVSFSTISLCPGVAAVCSRHLSRTDERSVLRMLKPYNQACLDPLRQGVRPRSTPLTSALTPHALAIIYKNEGASYTNNCLCTGRASPSYSILLLGSTEVLLYLSSCYPWVFSVHPLSSVWVYSRRSPPVF